MRRFVWHSVLLCTLLFIPIVSCGEGDADVEKDLKSGNQINICILLDLSDRLEPTKHPSSPQHRERDIEVIAEVIRRFREDMTEKGAFGAKGRIRTIFSPTPPNSNINVLAERMHVDLGAMDPAEKRVVFDSLQTWYSTSLEQIYDVVLETKNYIGADVWRFFKEGQVEDYCIASDPSYRNILVILTDGYLYHQASTDRAINRTAYVTGPLLERAGFRRNVAWREKFEGGDYGLIDVGRRLENLEVLVAEVNPSAAHPNDFELLQAYWGKWFENMGISHYRLVKTDLPVHSSKVINSFFANS